MFIIVALRRTFEGSNDELYFWSVSLSVFTCVLVIFHCL